MSCFDISYINEIGERDEQQDSVFCDRNDHFAVGVVADGMGGMNHGAEISHIITENLRNICEEADIYKEKEYPKLLKCVAYNVNDKVREYLAGCENLGGSTLVMALIKEKHLYYLSVGDSRVYIVHRKKIKKLNREHNFGNELDDCVRDGVLSKEEAENNKILKVKEVSGVPTYNFVSEKEVTKERDDIHEINLNNVDDEDNYSQSETSQFESEYESEYQSGHLIDYQTDYPDDDKQDSDSMFEVTVDFDGAGTKKMFASFAKLKKI